MVAENVSARAGDTLAGGLQVGLVSAYPPSRNSLNEYGFHLVRHMAQHPDVSEVVVFSDVAASVAPIQVDGARNMSCWAFNSIWSLFNIIHAVTASKVDVLYFNIQFATFGDRRLPGAMGLLAPLILRFLGVPVVVILHNLADNVDMKDAGFASNRISAWLMKTAGRILTRALLSADLVAVTIPRYVEFLRASYGAKNVILAPHGVFDVPTEPDFDIRDSRKIMAFGKWGTYKTVDILVEAYEILRRRGMTDLELVLAGTDSPNSPGYMAQVAERYSEVPNLALPGYIEECDVPRLFESASVVAFPYSSTTGSSGVLHQAGQFGRAVVLPRIGDLVDIVEEEGYRGEYFKQGDAESLATALARILENPELRVSLGRRNFAAAAGTPMSDVVDWQILHGLRIIAKREN